MREPGEEGTDAVGAWEADGEIVGIVHPEHEMGTAYFQIDPAYERLKEEMLDYAEEEIGTPDEGVKRLRMYVNEQDFAFQESGHIDRDLCYTKGWPSARRWMTHPARAV